MDLASTSLIVGCGYLGSRLAERLLARGLTVYGTTRGPDTAGKLAQLGVRPMMVSVTQPVTFAALRPALEADPLDVYHLVPPGRPGNSPTPRQTVLGGVAHLVKQLRNTHVRRAVLTSSTAVYGQRDGQRIDADTTPVPVDERGKLLLEGEKLWRGAGDAYHVVRLAGLYGPGRIIGLGAVRDGAPLLGDPQALLNLIHVDDAVDLLLAVMTTEAPGRVELGCDGNPVPRIDYYTHLAQTIGAPAPPVMDNDAAAAQLGVNAERLRRSSSKALDNIPTCRRTGWAPRYGNFRVGIDAALGDTRNARRGRPKGIFDLSDPA